MLISWTIFLFLEIGLGYIVLMRQDVDEDVHVILWVMLAFMTIMSMLLATRIIRNFLV